jgi:ABC-type multidrug transport system ATPase subunit
MSRFIAEEEEIQRLRVDNLTLKLKKNNRVILDNVFADFKVGQVTALIGKSGAGKSTFLNFLSGRFNNSSMDVVSEDINVLVGRNSSFLYREQVSEAQKNRDVQVED